MGAVASRIWCPVFLQLKIAHSRGSILLTGESGELSTRSSVFSETGTYHASTSPKSCTTNEAVQRSHTTNEAVQRSSTTSQKPIKIYNATRKCQTPYLRCWFLGRSGLTPLTVARTTKVWGGQFPASADGSCPTEGFSAASRSRSPESLRPLHLVLYGRWCRSLCHIQTRKPNKILEKSHSNKKT